MPNIEQAMQNRISMDRSSYRPILLQVVKELVATAGDKPIVLQLSGGCDSASLAICLTELGVDFTVHHYRFALGSKVNPDTVASRAIADALGLKLKEYTFGPSDVLPSIKRLKGMGYFGKVNLQCLVGHLPMAEAIHESFIINGSFADVIWGAYRPMQFLVKKPPEFLAARTKSFGRPNIDGNVYLSELMARNGNVVVYPFKDERLVRWFFDRNGLELHIGPTGGRKMKGRFYCEFDGALPPEVIKTISRRSQQIASGVREFLEGQQVGYLK